MTVMVLPIEAGEPNYRDAELPYVLNFRFFFRGELTDMRPYSLSSGYAALNMSPMARAPEVTAPGKAFDRSISKQYVHGSLTADFSWRNPVHFCSNPEGRASSDCCINHRRTG